MRRLTIIQGEQAVAGEPGTTIVTVLGSCIAVCLADPANRMGGMNHFLLGTPTGTPPPAHEMQRYGVHAMELLINALMQRGSSRADLRAHLYGGATMIAGLGDIGTRNIAFARRFLKTEGITISHEDVGGSRARRVEFLPYEGRSRCLLVRDTGALQAPPSAREPVLVSAGELELF